MSADAGYLALIDRLTTVRPPVFVFGGYAEDALLVGRTTRPHDDVDVLVGRVDLAEHLLIRTGAFGPPRPKDDAAQAQLRRTLLAGIPAAELEPEFGQYPP